MNDIIITTFYFAVLFVLRFFSGFFLYLPVGIPLQLIISQLLNLLIPTVLYFLITKKEVYSALKLNLVNIKTIVLTIVLCMFLQPSMSFLSAITTLLVPNVAKSIAIAFENTNIVMAVLAIGLTPAICEEIVFRGVIMSGYEKIGLKQSIILNGLLFSLLHLSIQQSLYAFTLGALFAYLVYITRSTLTSIIAHFTINTTQLLLIWPAVKNGGIEESAEITLKQIMPIFFLSLATLPFVILLINLIKRSQKNDYDS